MTQSPKTTGTIIYEAIVDLHNQEQPVTREVLAEVTGLKLTVIDDHVDRFIEQERLRRVKNGVFVPMDPPPPARAVTVTVVPGGLYKVEIGDLVIDLWPREARSLGALLAGDAVRFSAIQLSQETGMIATELYAELTRLRRKVGRLEQQVNPPPQMGLDGFESTSDAVISQEPPHRAKHLCG